MTSPEHKENHTIPMRLILSTLVLIFFLTYNWSRRWLYYYGSKIKGPFAWPIIGSTYLFVGGYKDSYTILTKLINSQPSIFKLWMGTKLVILTTQPTHAEVILKTCFNRLGTKHMEELFQTGLLTSPADIWRTRRRIINKSFNTNILNAYVDIFDKRARHLMQHFEEKCDGNYIDVLEAFISCSLGTACETLFDVDSNLITGQDRYIANVSRMAEIVMIRASNIWLHPNFIWKYSSLRKELTTINRENFNFLRQIIQMKKMDSAFCKNTYSGSGGKEKLFLNNLLNLESESEKLSETDVVDEMHTILCAATETIAITVGLLLSMMGLYPTIQKSIQEELDSIFDSSERNVTVEDVNKMYCLERVIKETMRLFPAVPFIKRAVDKDIQLDSHVLPKDSEVYIPVMSLHRRPDLWKDPLVFDPDRFLAESEASRPAYSYLPFSSGTKNCIGFKYAMLSMKTTLAVFFKHYEVQSSKHKSIEELDFRVNIVAYPKEGCRVKLKKREKKSMTSPEHKENHTIPLRLILFILVLIFFLKYNWNRRWLYYYGSKIKGPFAWPIIGSTYLFVGGYKDSYKILTNLIDSQPPIFKLWMGIKLVILTTQPTHAEVILKTCFNRLGTTKHMEELFQTGLFTSPADIWRTRRRIINKSFNTNILNAYVDIFDKRARHLMQHFEEKCDGNYIDVLEAFISCSLGTACETLFDVDSSLITGQDQYIANINRMAEILLIRASSIWLHPNFIWKYNSLRKELTTINRENFNFLRQIIQMKKIDSAFCKNTYSGSGGKDKLFLNNLLSVEAESAKLSETDVLDEMHTILCAGTETIALTVGLLLSMMGLYPTIQKSIQEELDSIFGSSERNVTVEDVNKMYCLERVIKETMRLFPAAPFIRRAVDKDIKLDSHVLPKESEVYISVMYLHRRPDLWKDPLVFDPDRFLSESEASRPAYSYLPFSSGTKNCIGFKYAMLSMKTTLAVFFKHYEVQSSKHKSIEELDFRVNIVAYPKGGCRVKLKKREKKCF
ncbi:unnamed protein product [Tenebrio molitor]|nr:unnamed protein product [Tenebrio molitor]